MKTEQEIAALIERDTALWSKEKRTRDEKRELNEITDALHAAGFYLDSQGKAWVKAAMITLPIHPTARPILLQLTLPDDFVAQLGMSVTITMDGESIPCQIVAVGSVGTVHIKESAAAE